MYEIFSEYVYVEFSQNFHIEIEKYFSYLGGKLANHFTKPFV